MNSNIPASVETLPAFLRAFEHVAECGYSRLLNDPTAYSDADDMKGDMANACEEAAAIVGIDADNPETLGALIEAARQRFDIPHADDVTFTGGES